MSSNNVSATQSNRPGELLFLPDTPEVQSHVQSGGAALTFLDVAHDIVARLGELLSSKGLGLSSGKQISCKKELQFLSDCLSAGHEKTQLSCAVFARNTFATVDVKPIQSVDGSRDSRKDAKTELGQIYSNRATLRTRPGLSASGTLASGDSIVEEGLADQGEAGTRFIEPRPDYHLRGAMHHHKNHMVNGEASSKAGMESLTKGGGGLPWMGQAVPQWPRQDVPGADEAKMHRCINDSFNNWHFDIFAFTRLSGGKTLQFTGWECMRRGGCFTEFHVHPQKASKFLQSCAAKYCSEQDAPYHNSIHAADVAQTVHAMIVELGLAALFNPMDNLVSTVAAIVHDLGHDGRNNAFHMSVKSHVAITYNDRSVLENFHVATASRLLADPETSMLEALQREQLFIVRRELIDMVLSTDMALHFKRVGAFHDLVTKLEQDWMAWQGEDEQMDVVRAMILHTADISNQAKPFKLSQQWSCRALSEFFAQGDQEKTLNLPISPMCDRATTSMAGSQVGFIQFIVQPSFLALSKLLTKASSICLKEIEINRKTWEHRQSLDEDKPEAKGQRIQVQYVTEEAEEAGDALLKEATSMTSKGKQEPGNNATKERLGNINALVDLANSKTDEAVVCAEPFKENDIVSNHAQVAPSNIIKGFGNCLMPNCFEKSGDNRARSVFLDGDDGRVYV